MSGTIERLLGCPARTFLDERWDARPLRVSGASDRFADLFGSAEVDELLAGNALEPDALTLVQGGKRVPRDLYRDSLPIGSRRSAHDAVHHESVRDLHAGGASLLMHGLERKRPALRELADALAGELGVTASVNAILGPPGAAERSLGLHYDVCGVLVLQLEGSKEWRLYAPSFELPLAHHGFAAYGDPSPGPVVERWLLRPGDALFVPRGHPHVAEPTWERSLHLAVQLVPRTIYDVLREELLEGLERAAASDVSLRRSALTAAPAPGAPCRLADVHPGDLYRASGAPFEYQRRDVDGVACLEVCDPGGTLELPPEIEPLLERMRGSSDPFEVAALPIHLPARLQRRALAALAERGLIHRCSVAT